MSDNNHKIPLSVAIIAKNEADNILGCLNSAAFADDVVVVVDSRSTDNTAEIARAFGCRVFIEDFKGHSEQKNSAVDKCIYQWVFSLDADERIPHDTRAAVIEAIKSPKANVYRFPRKNHLHNRWLKRGDFWPDWQIRLFKKDSGRFMHSPHDRWVTEAVIETIWHPIEHFSFKDYEDMIVRMNLYSTIGAIELDKKGAKASTLTPVLHGTAMFIKIYLQKRGFMDGIDGLVNALLKASGSFFKYAKLIELQKQKGCEIKDVGR